ncbi:porin family protein [Marinirhabdus gelatinilytica]|uniref:Outer membrane protein with beta-barrel domain n=1 Tax=Marinirhabdus gelatinilytica TaxID=1703343 RepID=A0A370QAE4_9FLAO|nr:porin family protein [Marinirhabdus gelatinilytica]RDK85348.1 outer membrane protein with beta-barrel domain [Marinirhabdus gelatinilytica]
MKKQVLFIAIAIFSFGAMNAQDLRFGAKAGVNFASIGGDNTDDVEGRTGFHIGGLVEIMFTEKFGIQPEILYSAQGYSLEDEEDGFTFSDETNLDYINIPVMAKYYIVEGLAVEAGPQVGFLVSANQEFEVQGPNDEQFESGEEDISDFVSGIDFGLALGASYRLDMGVFFGARYTLGLSNINEGDVDFGIFGDLDIDVPENQNNVFQVSVGYSF